MQPVQSTSGVDCLICNTHFEADDSATFPIDPQTSLCAPCAMRRGGHYDTRHDLWAKRPYTADLHVTARIRKVLGRGRQA